MKPLNSTTEAQSSAYQPPPDKPVGHPSTQPAERPIAKGSGTPVDPPQLGRSRPTDT